MRTPRRSSTSTTERVLAVLLTCAAARAAAQAPASAILPPERLYHFGQRAHLVQDAKDNTIPQDVWDKFIVGDSTTFQLNPFRRGLYGTTHPAFGDQFGDWFMTIHVKPECRQPDAVLIPSDLATSAPMRSWFAARHDLPIGDFPSFVQQCFRESTDLDGVAARRLLRVQNVPPKGEASTEGPCERVLQQYYADAKPRMILDEQWPEQQSIGLNLVDHVSWYVRDRTCIAGIDGQERDVVPMMAAVPDFWGGQTVARVDQFEAAGVVDLTQSVSRATLVRMLLVALAEAPDAASDADLAKIRADAARGYQPLQPLAASAGDLVPPIVDAFRRCRQAGEVDRFRSVVPRGDFELTEIPAISAQLPSLCAPPRYLFLGIAGGSGGR